MLDAELNVGTLILRGGELWGDVTATRLVELYAPAKLHGNIRAPQVYMDKGVVFEGQCVMLEEANESSEAPAGGSEQGESAEEPNSQG